MSLRVTHAVVTAVALIAIAAAAAWALWSPKGPTTVDAQGVPLDTIEPKITPVRDGIFLLVGAGGNIVVQTGDDGVLLVDTQYALLGPKNLAAIRSATAAPIRYVINTHAHSDHVGGNAFFRGYDVDGRKLRGDGDPQPEVIAHESVAEDVRAARFRSTWLPSEPYAEARELDFNGDQVMLLHQPSAHTRGDTVVVFESAGVIAAGDIYNGTGYPFIDRWKGGSVQGVLAGLNRMLELAAARRDEDTVALVIPGHGAIAEAAEVAAYRDMIATVVERIERMIAAGMTLEQIQAARPTLEYDERYGRNSGNGTAADFVAAVHHDLTK